MEVYDIFLNTPLGKKRGELRVNIENGKLIGFLSLFGHTELIEGTVDENGKCLLAGKFITLLNTVSFSADGVINHDILNLKVKSGGSVYEMEGVIYDIEGVPQRRKEES